MSARLYRKILTEREQTKTPEAANVLAEQLEEDESDSGAPSLNPFDLLNDIDHETVDNKLKKKKKTKKKKEISESQSPNVDETASSSKRKSTAGKKPKSHILNVDSKLLNGENELRRIFGSKVVSEFENANQAGPSMRKSGINTRRKPLLASPCEHWFRWDGSLSMELLESKNGNHYFRYTRSGSYIKAQRAFEFSKTIDDLNGVASVVMSHPYHVESLLTLSEYFRYSVDYRMAADFNAKCLYALESAWHPEFDPFKGNCILEYTHETNKPLFISLFNHMKNLDRRGCHRSALQVCKLLLSLDPSDPMGAIFCIDYFSLRAEEYAWVERFTEEYKTDKSLRNFPNFAYSLPICRFYLEKAVGEDSHETVINLMINALKLYPSVVKRLVEKVPLNDKAWTRITSTALFQSENTGIPLLDHLIRIYVERSYIIWRLPVLHKLLKDSALQVVDTLEYFDLSVREQAFPSDKNEYSHLQVSDFSDMAEILPPENLQDLLMVDPWLGDTSENRSPLTVLLESIWPWVHFETDDDGYQNQPQESHDENRSRLPELLESIRPWVHFETGDDGYQNQPRNPVMILQWT